MYVGQSAGHHMGDQVRHHESMQGFVCQLLQQSFMYLEFWYVNCPDMFYFVVRFTMSLVTALFLASFAFIFVLQFMLENLTPMVSTATATQLHTQETQLPNWLCPQKMIFELNVKKVNL